MNFLNPIFTEKRECQDCYKCVRNCPVKAIKVEGGYASVIPELCICCGQCVEVCPNHAKRVRDDLPKVRQLLQEKKQVFVSLAPSFISEFPEWRPAQIIKALKALGFAGVSETALGAQQVSAQAVAALQSGQRPILFSSACPSVVSYLQKHKPLEAGHLTGLLSPLLTHCRMLRAQFGGDIGVVFVGPCIAKKLEAADHPELLEVAITFEDLRRWLDSVGVDPGTLEPGAEDHFVPECSAEGAWYPVDGGMIAGMKANCAINDSSFMAFSGIGPIERAIDGLAGFKPDRGLFLELLACEGGCVNGPRSATRTGTLAKRCRVLSYGHLPGGAIPVRPGINIAAQYPPSKADDVRHPETQVVEALRQVGKFSREDELNCGGCGYNSCREFAGAFLDQKAERSMCVTYMRKLAHKKANALIQKMPSAVVIINDAMRILEFNQAFAAMFEGKQEASPSMPLLQEGVMLSEIMPYAALFHSVLKSGEDIVDRDLRYKNTILHATIFSIEKHCVVGGILQDITEPAVRKEQVIRKAQEVIQRSLATTQQIARLLGENAAESEITLNSIIDSFTPSKPEDPKQENDWRKLYRR